MLILHGARDVLVNPAVAREHARIVPQSQLLMDEGDHFAAFQQPAVVAQAIGEFVDRVEGGTATTRRTADPARLEAAARPFNPRDIPPVEGLALGVLFLLLMAATLISEDLTCITTGLMVARGTVGFGTGTLACFLGIFLGDLLLFLAGRRLGSTVLRWRPVRWFISPEAIAWSSQWLERQGAMLVFATRLLPGTRLPTYFAAGVLRTSLPRFALYFFIACALWTPLLIGVAAGFGEVAQRALQVMRERAGLYLLVSGLVLFVLLKVLIPLATWRGRRLQLSRWRLGLLSSRGSVCGLAGPAPPPPAAVHRGESVHPRRRIRRRIEVRYPERIVAAPGPAGAMGAAAGLGTARRADDTAAGVP
jgi:membrane protein DedA with SNARE-associated domain